MQGGEIRRARKRAGLTQVLLARLAHVPQSDLSRAERGLLRLGAGQLLRLAVVLGIDPETVLREKS